jgi:co-chaperonin GroES (HSP10)
LIEPIAPTPRSEVVAITDRDVPVIGRVVALGTGHCPECGAQLVPDVDIGAIVVVPPTAGQEITHDGHEYWIVPFADIGAEWKAPHE